MWEDKFFLLGLLPELVIRLDKSKSESSSSSCNLQLGFLYFTHFYLKTEAKSNFETYFYVSWRTAVTCVNLI
jgi:hypothetical protein